MVVAYKSVTGEIRENNEDSVYVDDKLKQIYIVADGMGGHNAGEIASRVAIDSFVEYFHANYTDNIDAGEMGDLLVGAVSYCNKKVYEIGCKDEGLKNMGTTFTVVAVVKDRAVIAQVGDSRAYVYRDKKLIQLTKDHSYVMEMVRQGKITVEEASVHPKRNIITRAIGTDKDVKVDIAFEPLKEKDLILLCSDGLYSMITDKDIEKCLKKKKELSDIVNELVDKANDNGGKDNISVIIIGYEVGP